MRLTKIFRLVRLLNLKAFQDMEESGKVNPAVVRLMKLVVAFMLVLHITACAYWFMVHNQCAGAFTLVDGKPTNTMQNFCPEKEDIGQVICRSHACCSHTYCYANTTLPAYACTRLP
jgi:hypothetical protein